MMKLNHLEYQTLKGEYNGYGAHGAALFEILYEAGFVTWQGHITPLGEKAIEEYEGRALANTGE